MYFDAKLIIKRTVHFLLVSNISTTKCEINKEVEPPFFH